MSTWAYTFPCADRIHPGVLSGLPEWYKQFLPLEPDQILDRLSERWSGVPDWLRPLADVVLGARSIRIVGDGSAAVAALEFSNKPESKDEPWQPLPFAPTPWAVRPLKARLFLMTRSPEYFLNPVAACTLRGEELAYEAHGAWQVWNNFYRWEAKGQAPPEDPDEEDEDEGIWHLYLPPPIDREEAEAATARVGLGDTATELAYHFNGIAESEPGVAGGFTDAREWVTFFANYAPCLDMEDDFRHRIWARSIVVFVTRNGQPILVRPKNGRMAHFVLQEGKLLEPWRDLPQFVAHWLDYHQKYCWPFDSYGPA